MRFGPWPPDFINQSDHVLVTFPPPSFSKGFVKAKSLFLISLLTWFLVCQALPAFASTRVPEVSFVVMSVGLPMTGDPNFLLLGGRVIQ